MIRIRILLRKTRNRIARKNIARKEALQKQSMVITMPREKQEFIEYDWQYEGSEALFGADLTLISDTDALQTVAVEMRCTARGQALSVGEIRAYEGLKKRILRKTSCTFLGFIETKDTVRYYFYVASADTAEIISDIVGRNRHVTVEARQDAEHVIYRKLLYPNAKKLRTETNRAQLAEYGARGDSISLPRTINLHVYFPTEPLRVLFEEQARLSGFAIGSAEYAAEYELPYGVCVHKVSTLVKSEVDNVTSRLIDVAEKYSGALIDWDAPIVPKKR